MSRPVSSQRFPSPEEQNTSVSELQVEEGILASPGVIPAPIVGTGATASTTDTSASPFALRLGNIRRFLSLNPKMTFGLIVAFLFLVLAVVGPMFIHQDPNSFSNDILEAPSATHWLGTTQTGQDVFVQVVVGARVSVLLGFGTGLIVTCISVIIGLISGYLGGIADDILSLLTNIFIVLPSFPLAIVLASYLPFKGPTTVAFVITITSWAWGARVLRAQTMSMRNRDFVEAARSTGEGTLRIIFFEILPNEIAIVAAGFVGTTVFVILAEAALEFLGLGNSSIVSWGTMFFWAYNNDALLLGAWWWIIPPGLCIAILGASLAFINFGIDEMANPRLRRESKLKSKKLKKAEA